MRGELRPEKFQGERVINRNRSEAIASRRAVLRALASSGAALALGGCASRAAGEKSLIFSEHMTGLDLYLDPSMVDSSHSEHVCTILKNALKALEGSGSRA